MEGWVVLELLGYRTVVGRLTECEIAGTGFLKIEIPDKEDGFQRVQYYAVGAVYCITPTTEAECRVKRPPLLTVATHAITGVAEISEGGHEGENLDFEDPFSDE